MTQQSSSERLAEAMEHARHHWQTEIKAEATARAATSTSDDCLAALKAVEDGHQTMLKKVKALRQSLNSLREVGERQAKQAMAGLQELGVFFATHLPSHLEEDEKRFLPLLEQSPSPESSSLAARVKADHKAILRKLEQFSDCLEIGGQTEKDGMARFVLADLCLFGSELCDLLDAHLHDEMQAIHEFSAAGECRELLAGHAKKPGEVLAQHPLARE